jgi:phenylacetate-CoA ligase
MYWSQEETLSYDKLSKLQLDRLQSLVDRLYKDSTFYKELFDTNSIKPTDIKSLKDIQKIPFTTKDDIRKSYPFGMLTVDKKKLLSLHSSSGSSGIPTISAYTQKDIDTWSELMSRCYHMCGVNSNDIIHNSYSYGLFTGGFGFHYGANNISATIVPASTGHTDRQLQLLRDFDTTVLASTPSYALHLATKAQEQSIDYLDNYNLRVGIFGAEPVSRGLKESISRYWDIKYHEIYGLSELLGPGVACSCDSSDNLHLFDDHFFSRDSRPLYIRPIG